MNYYVIAKILHIVSMAAWMAGMFYLPRLFAYHAGTTPGSESSELLKIMERRLLRIIVNPAMFSTIGFGLYMAITSEAFDTGEYWLHAKLSLVFMLTALHGYFAVQRKKLARDERPHTPKFYKIVNELATVIFIGIVTMVVWRPF